METFRKLLRDNDLKATPQRIAVHTAMMALVHASADEVSACISDNGLGPVTVSSVYNILSSLADLGIYERRMSAGSRMIFDVNTFAHLHIYDTASDSVMDVWDEDFVKLVEGHFKGRRYKGYRLERVDIQLVCRPTRRNIKNKS